jgi:hypothetical protein
MFVGAEETEFVGCGGTDLLSMSMALPGEPWDGTKDGKDDTEPESTQEKVRLVI